MIPFNVLLAKHTHVFLSCRWLVVPPATWYIFYNVVENVNNNKVAILIIRTLKYQDKLIELPYTTVFENVSIETTSHMFW